MGERAGAVKLLGSSADGLLLGCAVGEGDDAELTCGGGLFDVPAVDRDSDTQFSFGASLLQGHVEPGRGLECQAGRYGTLDILRRSKLTERPSEPDSLRAEYLDDDGRTGTRRGHGNQESLASAPPAECRGTAARGRGHENGDQQQLNDAYTLHRVHWLARRRRTPSGAAVAPSNDENAQNGRFSNLGPPTMASRSGAGVTSCYRQPFSGGVR